MQRFASSLLCVLIFAFAPSSASSQALEITSTDPAEAATAVSATKRVEFRLNKPLPTFGSAFARKFMWSPMNATRLTKFGHDFDSEGKLTIIFFTVEHEPSTDVSFIAFGIQAADGSRMERPFVLNYTTAPTQGENTVAGTVDFGERVFAPAAAKRQVFEGAVRRAVWRSRLDVSSEGGEFSTSKSTGSGSSTFQRTAYTQELRRTVVLLLDRYLLDDDRWVIRKAVVPDAAGSFALDNVRDGTYWPVAINFATDDGEVIGSYGFHDPDGDLEPDAVDVSGGSIGDLSLTLYSASPFTALSNLPLAEDIAAQYASDQRLITVKALQGPALWEAYPDGTADMWRYTFFSPSESRLTYVAIDPINYLLDTNEGAAYERVAMPESMVDTDLVMEVADEHTGDAFRAQHPDQIMEVTIDGGDLPLSYRPAESEVFWMVVYRTPDDAASDTAFVDAESGGILQAQHVARGREADVPMQFVLEQNYPNPFNPSTRIPFQIHQAGGVTLQVLDALGREVVRLLDRNVAPGSYAVEWNAQDVPSGVYFCRLTVHGRTETRMMTFVK